MRWLTGLRQLVSPPLWDLEDTADQWPQVYISTEVLADTGRLLSSYRGEEEPHEGIVYWAGVAVETTWVITTVLAPVATTTPGSYKTSAVANAMVVVRANELHLQVLAQAHGHPGSWVGHSEGDNQGAFMPYPGFYSVVVPRYGSQGLIPLTKCGIHRYQGRKFVRLNPGEVERLFLVVPSSIDLRGDL